MSDDGRSPPDTIVRNERVKLTAGLLNTVAGFSITAGGLAPLIAISYGLATGPSFAPLVITSIVAMWWLVGIGAHLVARHLLGRLSS